MAKCPNCGGDIEEDFGLIDCIHCGSSIFVEFDGEVKAAKMEGSHVNPITKNFRTGSLPKISEDDLLESLPENIDEEQDIQFEIVEQDSIEEPQQQIAAEIVEPTDESDEDFATENAENQEDLLYDVEEAESETYEPETNDSLKDIAEYGNSDQSKGDEGLYQYTLVITGIDSKEIRTALRDTFTDERFKWEVNAIMAQIESGQLIIKDLNPVKASMLINNIKYLPVEIKWEQHDLVS